MTKRITSSLIFIIFFVSLFAIVKVAWDGQRKIMEDISILADNCYYEARGSSFDDKIGVMLTVLNRVNSPKYPNSIKEVVYQPYQFSWVKYKNKNNRSDPAWQECYHLAKMVIRDYKYINNKDVCLHYVKQQSYPDGHWSYKFNKKTLIGGHLYLCEEKS